MAVTKGIDIHPTFQAGLDVTTLPAQGYAFLMCKVTEGNGWFREGYHSISAAAKSAGLLFSAYHFLRNDSTAQSQAAWTKACMRGDHGVVPVMVDWETCTDGSKPSKAYADAYITELRRLGGKVGLVYVPRWYWLAIGSPSLSAGAVGTCGITNSSYGANAISQAYPGDSSGGWGSFGGRTPDILQYGSEQRVSGYSGALDVNAFKGTRTDLARKGWFYDPQGEDVAITQDDVNLIIAGIQNMQVPRPTNINYASNPTTWPTSGATGTARFDYLTHLGLVRLEGITNALNAFVTAEAGRDSADATAQNTNRETLLAAIAAINADMDQATLDQLAHTIAADVVANQGNALTPEDLTGVSDAVKAAVRGTLGGLHGTWEAAPDAPTA